MATRATNLITPGARAVVTGASSGIGAATARLLARHGLRVAVQSRGGPALDAVAGELGAFPCVADLTDPGAAERVYEDATSSLGPVDVLVCNAGVGWEGPLTSMSAERVEELVRLNLLANAQLVRVFSAEMVRRGRGHIALVGSIAGHMGVGGEAVYSATKAGLRVFGDSLRLELASSGVGVTVVNPGAVRTEFFERRGSPYQRKLPRPVAPTTVAEGLVRGVRRGDPEVFVPRWLRLPARLQGAVPGLVGSLRRR